MEDAAKDTYPLTWAVDGVARADAHLVSRRDGRPAYGGTPSDDSVVQAIAALKARGLKILFNPFLFMDVADGNVLPAPPDTHLLINSAYSACYSGRGDWDRAGSYWPYTE